jgi:hypothetical protein
LPPPGFPAPSATGYPGAHRASAPTTAGSRGYASIRGLWVALAWLLGIEGLVALALAGTIVNRMVKLNDFDQTRSFTNLANYHDADDAVSGAHGWLAIIGIAILVLIIIYFFRASRNTALWRSDRPTWAPGWTIGAWFIPLANAIIPCMVICEIWNRSAEPPGAGNATRPGAGRVIWCWVVFVVALIAASLDYTTSSISEARTEDWINLAGALALAVALVLFIFILRELTRRQESMAAAGVSGAV